MGILSTRQRTALTLSVLALSLAACQQPDTPQGPAKVPTVTAAEPARGELTTQSPVNINDGSRYAELAVDLKANTTVRISQEGALQGVLSLYRDGELLSVSGGNTAFGGVADCCGGAGDSRRPATALVYSPKADGIYRLGVSGADASRYGPFRVSLQEVNVRNSGPVRVGESLEGALTSAAPATGSPAPTGYELLIEEAGLYDITLRSTFFDAFLNLSGNGVTLEDDDGGGGSDARLNAWLEPGTYQLRASALDSPASGLYTLAVARQELPAGTKLMNSGELPLDSTITAMYSGRDMPYTLRVPERQTVTIDMKSEALDSYLKLQGEGIEVSDDDGGGGSDARLEQVLEPGTYTVTASGYDNGSGLFTLATRVGPAPEPGGGDIAVGDTVEAALTSRTGDEYRLRIARAGRYTIDMRSERIDSLLRITGPGVDQEDDDGGGNYDARLVVQLTPGEYVIRARSLDEDNGPYTLSVR